jgi:hypothetical protein
MSWFAAELFSVQEEALGGEDFFTATLHKPTTNITLSVLMNSTDGLFGLYGEIFVHRLTGCIGVAIGGNEPFCWNPEATLIHLRLADQSQRSFCLAELREATGEERRRFWYAQAVGCGS